jgi:hypothetical protein
MGTSPADHVIPSDVLTLPHLCRLLPRSSPSPIVDATHEDVDAVADERRTNKRGSDGDELTERVWQGACAVW